MSVGKKAIKKLPEIAVDLSFVISKVSLYTRKIFSIETMKGKRIVENSFIPKIIIESEFNAMNVNLRGKTG